jgi:AraC-like DNA-binding protein
MASNERYGIYMEKKNKINNLVFNIEQPLIFNWTGKFEAPYASWSHLTRTLYDYELMFVTKGTLYIMADNDQYEISDGEYIIMPPLVQQHGWKQSNCAFYWLHFAQNEGKVMFYNNDECTSKEYRICANGQYRTRYLFLPMSGTVPSPERMVILFKQLQDAEKRYQNKSYDDFYATSILLELKSQLSPGSGTASGSKNNTLCDNIKDYIHWHLCEHVTVAEVAAYYGYNARYLTTLFKEVTGTSIKDYIISIKIEQAKALLASTDNPVSKIGYSLGFQDNHNFSKYFKKATGLTPSGYRTEFNKNMVFHQ